VRLTREAQSQAMHPEAVTRCRKQCVALGMECKAPAASAVCACVCVCVCVCVCAETCLQCFQRHALDVGGIRGGGADWPQRLHVEHVDVPTRRQGCECVWGIFCVQHGTNTRSHMLTHTHTDTQTHRHTDTRTHADLSTPPDASSSSAGWNSRATTLPRWPRHSALICRAATSHSCVCVSKQRINHQLISTHQLPRPPAQQAIHPCADLDAAVGSARDDPAAVGAEARGGHLRGVATIHLNAAFAPHVPDLHTDSEAQGQA
jgi:hypothetical protein